MKRRAANAKRMIRSFPIIFLTLIFLAPASLHSETDHFRSAAYFGRLRLSDIPIGALSSHGSRATLDLHAQTHERKKHSQAPSPAEQPGQAKPKPTAEEALQILKLGNARFSAGKALHPHQDKNRLILAGTENQKNHAFATVLSCSDSRVPVEILFDAGIMDLFVVRVAGNICDTDEIGSIEYGVLHVNTPLVVIMGHTQCGAVTAVTQSLQDHTHELEKNIPPLIDNIEPAVKKILSENPDATIEHLIALGIEANVRQAKQDLLDRSPAIAKALLEDRCKILCAIYDVSTGIVKWLD